MFFLEERCSAMKVEFQGRNCEIEPRFVDHARPRLAGLSNFNDRLREARVLVAAQKGTHTVEITCDADGLVFRSEVRSDDALSSFDEALDGADGSLEPEGPGVLAIPRKEVIQPQVLLRLPCYDLVPVIDLTVGAALPEGLGQRLRVLPIPVA